ncbi:rhomboid family intramembrane serine protease [Niallia sp. XMNu-256]|uniref:rhomboid family intramembrane serine protease n=1 Tax=Niallia sp. XMNu-256 TaxID=3082444 RepID=UPI0030CC0978
MLSFREEYLYWRLAHLLIREHGYRFLQLSKSQKEIWLENTEKNDSSFVRIHLHDLDWSNWMQRDIQLTLINGESVRKQLRRRHAHVLNIYVTPYPPVDDYEFRLEKPLVHPKGGKTKVTTIICDRQSGAQQLEELFSSSFDFNLQEDYEQGEIEIEKKAFLLAVEEKIKSEKALLNNGKPIFTYLFIGIQVLIFLLMEFAGGSTNTSVLIQFGAKVNWLILHDGEWWRLFTPIVIHIGLLHLLMNTMALYYLGIMVEKIYGNLRFLFIYLFAGFTGALASLLFSSSISAGASGAIFGCFGALLYFGLIYPKLFKRTMGFNIIILIAVNLIFGFSIPGIDNAGHIGGLIGGFLASAIVHFPNTKKFLYQISAVVLSGFLVTGAIQFSFATPGKFVDEHSALVLAQSYIEKEQFDAAYTILNEFNIENKETVNTLFLLSFSEIKMGKIQEAKTHLYKVIQLKPDFHEAFYNLSIVYYNEENISKAIEYASQALSLQPSNQDYKSWLNEITSSDRESSALGA